MILFYDDSPVFGGHEVMAVQAVIGLVKDLSSPPVTFFANIENLRLAESLQKIRSENPGRLHIESAVLPPRKPVSIHSWFKKGQIAKLASRFAILKPNLLVAIQGDIALSTIGIHAAKQLGIPTVSYIPVPHSLAEMGAKFGGLRDFLDAPLFRLPDSFITISDSMAKKLESKTRPRQRVQVVYNGIDLDRFSPTAKSQAREQFDLPQSGNIIAQVGRIEFNQKRQDFLLRAVAESEAIKDVHLVFAGDGPDKQRLIEQSKALGYSEGVSFIPWQDDMANVYSAADILAIPSRFEGFPLVMLESVRCQTPVVGSDRDGMADFLPEAWRFRPDDASSCISTLVAALGSDCSGELERLNQRIRSTMSVEAFQQNFTQALRDLMCTAEMGKLAKQPLPDSRRGDLAEC